MAINWRRPFDLLGVPLILLYFLMTLSQEFLSTAIALLVISEADFSPEQLLWFRTLQFLPWSFRFVFGCISDAIPIAGYRRRPYVLLCNALGAVLYVLLGLFARSFYAVVSLGMALSVVQCWAEVCLDATAVEVGNCTHGDQVIDFDNSCLDTEDEAGPSATASLMINTEEPDGTEQRAQAAVGEVKKRSLPAEVQGTAMVARSTGSFLAAGLATVLSLFVAPLTLVLLTAVSSVFACLVSLRLPDHPVKRDWQAARCNPLQLASAACGRVKEVAGVLVRIMLAPLVFVLAYNSIPTSDVIVFSFLANIESEFSAPVLQSLTFIALLSALLGSLFYNAVLIQPGLRKVFVVGTLLSAAAQASYILIAAHINTTVLHIPDVVFVLVATAVSSCVSRIAMIPSLTLAAQSCPKGLEATVFSGFASVAHLGALASGGLSGLLARYLSITSTNFTQLPLFIGICSCAQLLPLLLLQFVPSAPPSLGSEPAGPSPLGPPYSPLANESNPSVSSAPGSPVSSH